VARHTKGPGWVSVEWSGVRPTLTVRDLGEGFVLPALDTPAVTQIGGRGLFLVDRLAHDLAVAARRGGGTTVTVTLPVTRPTPVDHDPPGHHRGVLPAVDEAGSDGFGKEAFLRALVVQLALAVEEQHGSDAAAAAVAQVGTDVGGQMEAEYRAARGVVGRLDTETLAECLVRLKRAIDGGFHVIELTDDRIVLGNDRCPFGDAVQRAPALCRMTSSVFGGIAARNSDDGATVVLEERIAVGDPSCRVVVDLRPDASLGHRYRRPV